MPVPPKLNAQLVSLEQAAHRVAAGHMSIEEFTALVDEAGVRFRKQLAHVEALDIPADFRAELQDEMAVGRRGVELYLQALDDLQSYARGRDLALLRSGVEKARVANDLVNEALRLNWTTYDTYMQSIEEYVAHAGGNIAAPPSL